MLMKPLTADKKKCLKVSKNSSINSEPVTPSKGEAEAPAPKRTHGKKEKSADSSKSSIGAIFDLSVLKMPVMTLLSIANVFGMSGYYIPYVYIAGYAEENIYGK